MSLFFISCVERGAIYICKVYVQSFPISSKCYWTVGPVNLKLLPDQNKFNQTVGGQWPIPTLRDQKNDKKTNLTKKNKQIVGQVWLGILPDLPLFYQTCPVGPTLLGKTVHALCFLRSGCPRFSVLEFLFHSAPVPLHYWGELLELNECKI